MNNLSVEYFNSAKVTTTPVECIDFEIDACELIVWLEEFADDFWGYNAIGCIDLPNDCDEIIIYDDDNTALTSIKYADFLGIFSGAKIIRKYALLRKSTKEVHYSDDEKYFFFDTYEDALAELKENTDLYSKKILFFNISDRYGQEIVYVNDNFIF